MKPLTVSGISASITHKMLSDLYPSHNHRQTDQGSGAQTVALSCYQ